MQISLNEWPLTRSVSICAIIVAQYTPAVKALSGMSPSSAERAARTPSPTFHMRVWSILPIGKPPSCLAPAITTLRISLPEATSS